MSDGHLKQIMDRILHLHAEEDEIKAGRRDVYAEAKAHGYDKTALGIAIRAIRNREKNETPEAQEREAVVSLYLATYDASHVHVRARETEYPAARLSPERDPQSGQHGSDSEGGQGGDGPTHVAGSEQESADDPQARNEPGSEEAASGGEGLRPLPETRPVAGQDAKPFEADDVPKFLHRSVNHYRPHCQKPDACGSSKLGHCFICQKAIDAANEGEAA